jgi:hypothetical protein
MGLEDRRRLPVWIEDRDLEHPEAATCRRLTPDERGQRLVDLCRVAAAVLRERTDQAAILYYQEPLPPSSERLLAQLRDRYRR